MSTKATTATNNTQYVHYEPHYYYCNACGRKSYQEGAVLGQLCGHYNSAPAKYPQQQCKGTMTSSANPGMQPVTAVAERETS